MALRQLDEQLVTGGEAMSGIRRRVRLIGGGAVVGFMVLLGSFPATDASISYNGSDYTEVAGPHLATTCDKEADSHRVRGGLDDNNSGGPVYNVYDNDGANAVCGNVFWERTVRRHTTCERNPLNHWACGNWANN
jgi:hypothetical protein